MRIRSAEEGLVGHSGWMFCCEISLFCSDNWSCVDRGGGGGILSGGLNLLTNISTAGVGMFSSAEQRESSSGISSGGKTDTSVTNGQEAS